MGIDQMLVYYKISKEGRIYASEQMLVYYKISKEGRIYANGGR